MKSIKHYSTLPFGPTVPKLLVGILLLACLMHSPERAYAQETKYERINKSKNKLNRRHKRRGDKGRSNKTKLRSARFKSRSRQGERAYRGDITGRKVNVKGTKRSRAAYAQPDPYAGRKRSDEASRAKAQRTSPRYSKRSAEQSGKYAGRAISSRSGKVTFTGKNAYRQRLGSNRSISRDPERPRKRLNIVPRSASGAYRIRKRKRPYAFRERSPWEKAFKGDITGRTFRTKRTTERPAIQRPGEVRYTRTGKRGDKPYSGFTGGFRTATRKPERAWKNDISGNKLRSRRSKRPDFTAPQFEPYFSSGPRGDRSFKGRLRGGGYKSVSSRKEVAGRKILERTPPGDGTRAGINFQGNIRARRPLKGGGSISGRTWNNRGRAIEGKGTTDQDMNTAGFQGRQRGLKPLKGGGSISGRTWNNRGRAIEGKGTTDQDLKVAGFQGNIRGRKPSKGGGSLKRNDWNNKGRPVEGRGMKSQDLKIAGFQGNIKSRKPLKGGGSISVHPWNNKGKAIDKDGPTDQDSQIAEHTGNIRRRLRGLYDGLSPVWKGDTKRKFNYVKNPSSAEKALKVREPQNNLAGNFLGHIKMKQNLKQNPSSNAESVRNRPPSDATTKATLFEGNARFRQKRKQNPNSHQESLLNRPPTDATTKATLFQGNARFRQKRKQNPNSHEESLLNRAPSEATTKATQFQGNARFRQKRKQNPDSHEESLLNRPPSEAVTKAMSFQGNAKFRQKRKQNPNSHEESLLNRPPTAAVVKATTYQGNQKRRIKYARNKNSADDALKGLPPSKATIQASSYQGNIKMRRKSLEDRHPSFRYAQGRNASTTEKEKTFSLKLLWSKFFKKNEGQPDHLKEKERKPRFDNRERDIWYD